MHLDADITLPDSFRRMLFNHTHLCRDSIYGADRVNVVGQWDISDHFDNRTPQHTYGAFISAGQNPAAHRYVDTLRGYVPIGYFQLWHSSCQKPYPYSLGTASHDDKMFAEQWPSGNRRLLPTVIVGHLCPEEPHVDQNWEGRKSYRLQPRS